MIRRFLLLFCLAILSHSATARGQERLTVVFTGNTNGKLEACECPNDPYGGLIERATLIKELRKEESPFLLIDGGRMVSLFGDYRERARVVVELMNLMGYDAAGIETAELFYGVAGSRFLQSAAAFPIISASVDSAGKPAFGLSVIKKVGAVTAAVVSLTDSSGIDRTGETRVRDFTLLPPETAMERALGSIGEKPAFLIVLSTLEPARNEEILRKFPQIDLIVETNGNRIYDTPNVSPDGVIVAPGFAGQFVGIVTLVKSPERLAVERFALLPVLDIPPDPEAAELLRKSNRP